MVGQLLADGMNVGRRPVAADVPQDPAFDPAEHTIAAIKLYVGEHPDQRDRVLAEEQAGRNRSTLITWLNEFNPAGAGAGETT